MHRHIVENPRPVSHMLADDTISLFANVDNDIITPSLSLIEDLEKNENHIWSKFWAVDSIS